MKYILLYTAVPHKLGNYIWYCITVTLGCAIAREHEISEYNLRHTRKSALLSGIIFTEIVHTAVLGVFAGASTTMRLKFSRPLKHRHSGMFLGRQDEFFGQQ